MLVIALTVIAATAVTVALATLHRRRARHGVAFAPPLDPLPAGLKHLAATVSDLSDLGVHLSAARQAAARKPRLGVLLGLR